MKALFLDRLKDTYFRVLEVSMDFIVSVFWVLVFAQVFRRVFFMSYCSYSERIPLKSLKLNSNIRWTLWKGVCIGVFLLFFFIFLATSKKWKQPTRMTTMKLA